jgi:hypothetical protein
MNDIVYRYIRLEQITIKYEPRDVSSQQLGAKHRLIALNVEIMYKTH